MQRTRQCAVWCELSTVAYWIDFCGGEHQKLVEPAVVQDEGIWLCRKLGMGTLYIFRFHSHTHTQTHTHTHILCDVIGAYIMINWFPESFRCRWLWPPCSLDMNCCCPLGLQLLCVTSTPIIFRICTQKLKFLIKSSQVRLCATDCPWNRTYLCMICAFVPWKTMNIL
jgi:hypothetical protein